MEFSIEQNLNFDHVLSIGQHRRVEGFLICGCENW